MSSKDSFHISLCADEAYASHASVALASLIDNISDPKLLRIWLLDAGLSLESRSKIQHFCRKQGVGLNILSAPCIDDELYSAGHVNRSMYARLYLANILDPSIKSCLYLDADIVVLDDVLKLTNYPLNGLHLGAVTDFYLDRSLELGLPSSRSYFNSGVLLVNLDLWRKSNTLHSILDYIKHHPRKLPYPDQDALNAVLSGSWSQFPLRWNQQRHFDDVLECLPDGGKKEEMAEAMNNPAIVHFCSFEKPWHYLCQHPDAHYYHYYLSRTPWADFSLPEPEDLPRFFEGKKVCVFGSGLTGSHAVKIYRKYGIYPEFFLDNDPKKVGTEQEDLSVHLPSILEKEDIDNLVIVVASMYSEQIIAQLKGMGLQEYRHFVRKGFEHLKGG